MSAAKPEVLILAPEPPARRAADALRAAVGSVPATVVAFENVTLAPIPQWTTLRSDALADDEQIHADFLQFLDRWPRQPLVENQSFDDLFRLVDGDSVWWTGPGSSRQPTTGPLFPVLRKLWICSRAIDQLRPQRVVAFTKNRRLATLLASKCARSGVPVSWVAGSVRPQRNSGGGQLAWLAVSLVGLALLPLWIVVRAIFARLTAGAPQDLAVEREKPAVVMSGWYPQHVRSSEGRSHVWYWRELAEQLAGAHGLRCRYLLHSSRFRFTGARKVLGLISTGWSKLPGVEGVMPLQQAYLSLGAFLRAAPAQVAALVRYCRLERQAAFRQSFEFAGADAAVLFIPALRHAVAGMAKWARSVDAIAQSIESVGNVQAVLVHEEFYHKGMMTIAAARRLGIPSIGVQHGTIAPAHLVYTVPPGHVAGAPNPDYFAAYGQFGKEVVSQHGAFPAERVWIAGGPRFDPLARQRPDVAAVRARLDLPAGAFIALLTTERYAWSHQPCAALFTAARQWPDVVVCVKTHPGDAAAMDQYEALAAECGATNVRFFRDRFDDLVAACDVLVSGSSTTMLEAMLCGKATICANFRDEPDRYPYVADGGSLGARNLAEMGVALEQLRDPEKAHAVHARRAEFLERHLGPTAEGRSAAVFARMIVENVLTPAASKLGAPTLRSVA